MELTSSRSARILSEKRRASTLRVKESIQILVSCVTEHEYGERGSAVDREMGGKTERGKRRRKSEMGGKRGSSIANVEGAM